MPAPGKLDVTDVARWLTFDPSQEATPEQMQRMSEAIQRAVAHVEV